MLEQVLMHLNNWFLVPGGIHEDAYTIRMAALRCLSCKTGSISVYAAASSMTACISTQSMG